MRLRNTILGALLAHCLVALPALAGAPEPLNLVGENPSWEIITDTGKPDNPTERFRGSLGLDGMYRKSPSYYGTDAVKGRWVNAHTFAMERRILGHSETQLWTLEFDGNKATINFEDTDGNRAEFHGEANE